MRIDPGPSVNEVQVIEFDQPDLGAEIGSLFPQQLDELDFGVIGFDAGTIVRVYNAFESKAAALSLKSVIGHPLFTIVAPCMNNFMVAQRFEDAAKNGVPLDTTLDYVLTLRMRPIKVQLRLLAPPGSALRYVLVSRRS